MSSLFKVQPVGLLIAKTGTSWEVVEMQNLGDIKPYLLQYVLWFCSIHPYDLLKVINFYQVWQPQLHGLFSLWYADCSRYPWELGCLGGGVRD